MSEFFEGFGVGHWLVLGIVIFMIGNFRSGQAKPHELLTETLRMMAKRKELHPKLAPTPPWLTSNKPPAAGTLGDYTSQATSAMTMQYSLLVDDWQLPQQCYIAADNVWRHVPLNAPLNDSAKSAAPLHGQALDFESLNPFVIAIATKANHIVIFWRDEAFVRQTKPAEQDLETLTDQLKQRLMTIGNLLNQSSH